MTDQTPDRLDAIRAREASAFPGPWYADSLTEVDGSTSFGVATKDDTFIVALQDLNPADAEFIAHAREDVPFLLAEVDRLRAQAAERAEDLAELAALRAYGVDNWDGYCDAMSTLDTDA